MWNFGVPSAPVYAYRGTLRTAEISSGIFLKLFHRRAPNRLAHLQFGYCSGLEVFRFHRKIFVNLPPRETLVGISSSEDDFPPVADTSLSMCIGLSADLLLNPFPMAG